MILDKKGAAQLLGVSVRQIDALRAKGGLPWHACGSLVRFDEGEVLRWFEAQRKTGGPAEQKPKREGGKDGEQS